MEKENQILCFQHCGSGLFVACFCVPTSCPVCGGQVAATPLRVPPFVLPSPFVTSRTSLCCVLVRPTSGSFLTDYVNTSDLHIGLSDSYGGVYHFDAIGAQYSADGWTECIAVSVISANNTNQCHLWDRLIVEFYTSYQQSHTVYSEDANNCFDFVLQFLQFYLHSVCSENQDELLMWDSVTDREKFCSSWIVPQTRKAARYISLYRRLLVEAVIVDSTGQQLVNVESYTTHL